MKKSTWFTDFIVGGKISEALKATNMRDLIKKGPDVTKQEIRNRILFWMSIMGSLVQVANLVYPYFMK